jgi:NDP-sugar pyrophosphorylase family protein
MNMVSYFSTLVEEFPIGNLPLHQHPLPNGWTKHPLAWVSVVDWKAALDTEVTTILDDHGEVLAWSGDEPDLSLSMQAFHSFLIEHPWDLLKANEEHLSDLDESAIEGEVHRSVVIEGHLRLGKGSRILPGVFIEGNVVIGGNCKVGPNCYIRGATSIGDQCHIGQAVEIKNSIILAQTAIGHLSYAGDSVIGRKVNFGAGTIISNFRHDGANHRSMIDGALIDTGRRKFGAIIGDHVHTGIHTAIYPGRKIAAHATTRPGEIVQRDIESPPNI